MCLFDLKGVFCWVVRRSNQMEWNSFRVYFHGQKRLIWFCGVIRPDDEEKQPSRYGNWWSRLIMPSYGEMGVKLQLFHDKLNCDYGPLHIQALFVLRRDQWVERTVERTCPREQDTLAVRPSGLPLLPETPHVPVFPFRRCPHDNLPLADPAARHEILHSLGSR